MLLFMAACDSGGSGGEEVNNEFTLDVTPTSSSSNAQVRAIEDKTLNGFSFFFDAENPETGQQAFAIYLSNSESFSRQSATQGLFGWIARGSDRPGSGTYSLKSGADFSGSAFAGVLWESFGGGGQSAPFYVIESGTLTLDASSDDRVAGSIDATATAFSFTSSGATQESVTLSGSFTAKGVDEFVSLSSPTN